MLRIIIFSLFFFAAMNLFAVTTPGKDSCMVKKPGLGLWAGVRTSTFWYDVGLVVINNERIYGAIKFSRELPSAKSVDGFVYKKVYTSIRPGFVFSNRSNKTEMVAHSFHADLRIISHSLTEEVNDPFLGTVVKNSLRENTFSGGIGYELNALHFIGHFFINCGISAGVVFYEEQPFRYQRNQGLGIKITERKFPLYLNLCLGAGFYIDQ